MHFKTNDLRVSLARTFRFWFGGGEMLHFTFLVKSERLMKAPIRSVFTCLLNHLYIESIFDLNWCGLNIPDALTKSLTVSSRSDKRSEVNHFSTIGLALSISHFEHLVESFGILFNSLTNSPENVHD